MVSCPSTATCSTSHVPTSCAGGSADLDFAPALAPDGTPATPARTNVTSPRHTARVSHRRPPSPSLLVVVVPSDAGVALAAERQVFNRTVRFGLYLSIAVL